MSGGTPPDGPHPPRVRWREADRLFAAALELPPERRSRFVDEACGGDGALHRAVSALLAEAMEGDGSFEGPGRAVLRAALRPDHSPGGSERP